MNPTTKTLRLPVRVDKDDIEVAKQNAAEWGYPTLTDCVYDRLKLPERNKIVGRPKKSESQAKETT